MLKAELGLATALVEALLEGSYERYADGDEALARSLRSRGLDEAAVVVSGGLVIQAALRRAAASKTSDVAALARRLERRKLEASREILSRVTFK